MTLHAGSGGSWRDVLSGKLFVGVGGSWQPVSEGWVGVGSVWEPFFIGVPDAVTGLSVSLLSSTSLRVEWDAAARATGYKVERSLDGSTGWTEVRDQAGTSWDDTGLADGTRYYYRVRAYNSAGNGPYSSVANNITTLKVPTLSTVATGVADPGDQLDITFTDGGSVAETQIRVYVSSVSGSSGFSLFATLAANDTAETLAGLSGSTTYWVKLRNYNAAYGESADSSVLSAATTGAPGTPSITVTPDCSTFLVEWADVANEAGYLAYYKQHGDIDWIQYGGTLAQGSDSVLMSGLSSGVVYDFKIDAFNGAGTSSSNTPTSQLLEAPGVPAKPTASDGGPNVITVSWPGVSGASGYTVQVDRGMGFSTIGSPAANTFDYDGWASGIATGPTPTLTSKDDNEVTIGWTNPGGDIGEKVVIYRNGVEVARLTNPATSYHDTGLSPSTTYVYSLRYFDEAPTDEASFFFKVRANNDCGSSAYSTQSDEFEPDEWGALGSGLSVTTDALSAPAAPSDMFCADVGFVTDGKVRCSWTDNSDNETSFSLERDDGGGFTEIASLGANTVLYDDDSAVNGTTYTYRVRAHNAAGYSSYSNEYVITPVGS